MIAVGHLLTNRLIPFTLGKIKTIQCRKIIEKIVCQRFRDKALIHHKQGSHRRIRHRGNNEVLLMLTPATDTSLLDREIILFLDFLAVLTGSLLLCICRISFLTRPPVTDYDLKTAQILVLLRHFGRLRKITPIVWFICLLRWLRGICSILSCFCVIIPSTSRHTCRHGKRHHNCC